VRNLLVVAAGFSALSSTGCAYMFRGSRQAVAIDSSVKGADVRNEGQFLGAAPLRTELDRDRDQNLQISKEGFVATQLHVRRRPSTGWFFWDIATCVIPITLCIPVLADGISGAWFDFEDSYAVKLEPAPPPGRPQATTPPD
jgi:hypothetical protein